MCNLSHKVYNFWVFTMIVLNVTEFFSISTAGDKYQVWAKTHVCVALG